MVGLEEITITVRYLLLLVRQLTTLTLYMGVSLSSLLAGNRRLREIIASNVQGYVAAQSKRAKGQIIADVVESVRRESPTGVGFVKMNPKTGRWSYIGTDKAKDKVSGTHILDSLFAVLVMR